MNNPTAPGELELDELIRSMEPVLHDELYVFATVDFTFNSESLLPLMSFREQEGITLIITKAQALSAGVTHEFPCSMITLNIHSSLDAVGFLARITQRLATLQMGVNPVSGFYHDHLFVPVAHAKAALQELKIMSSELSTS